MARLINFNELNQQSPQKPEINPPSSPLLPLHLTKQCAGCKLFLAFKNYYQQDHYCKSCRKKISSTNRKKVKDAKVKEFWIQNTERSLFSEHFSGLGDFTTVNAYSELGFTFVYFAQIRFDGFVRHTRHLLYKYAPAKTRSELQLGTAADHALAYIFNARIKQSSLSFLRYFTRYQVCRKCLQRLPTHAFSEHFDCFYTHFQNNPKNIVTYPLFFQKSQQTKTGWVRTCNLCLKNKTKEEVIEEAAHRSRATHEAFCWAELV